MSALATACPELRAEAHWRAVDFISDLHLSAALPRTFAALEGHLQYTDADAVLILGDLFEAWVGDDMREQPFERRCSAVLASSGKQRFTGFMVGNRDFLVGPQMRDESALQPLPDPTVLCAFGRRVLLTHGDAWCLDDRPYQAFRAEVRSPAWQTAFLALPLAERLQIAARMRQASTAAQQGFDNNPAVDVDRNEALRWMQATDSTDLVHGHTHRPGSDPLAPGLFRHVLSDWDLDQGDRAEVLRLTQGGFERLAPRTA